MNNSTPIRALLDAIENTPAELYGTGRGRFLCRLVHIILAKHANSDGTRIYAGLDRIAYLALASTKSTQKAINHLMSVNLARKLEEVHPVFGTCQHELIFPSAEVLENAARMRAESLRDQREKTRRRVASWRAKQAKERVTEAGSVTVTELPEVGNGTSGVGNGTSEGSVTEAASSYYRPLPSFLDRPSQPSILPSTDGGKAGSLKLFPKQNPRAIEVLCSWMSDLLAQKMSSRPVASKKHLRELARCLKGATEYLSFVVAFYQFLARPMGVADLQDPFGMFIREWPYREKDAHDRIIDDESETTTELLEDLHECVFQYGEAEEGIRPAIEILSATSELREVATA